MKKWFLAVKFQATPKILIPAIAGYTLVSSPPTLVALPQIVALVFLLIFSQWFIVLLNDFSDRHADAHHMRVYPKLIESRVLPEGLLSPNNVLCAGLISAICVIMVALLLVKMGCIQILPLSLLGLALLWAYSFPPLKLNYRGGGEVLEVIGTGCLLPVLGAFVASPTWNFDKAYYLLPILIYATISSFASGLKHEPADRENGKKTVCVLFGSSFVRRVIWALQILSRIWCGLLFLSGEYGLYAMVFSAIIPAIPMYNTRRYENKADFKDLDALRSYKKSLLQSGILTQFGLIVDFIFE